MVLLHTPQADFNSYLPHFNLPSVDGKAYSDKDFKGTKALVIMFICNHCPYVQAIEDRIIALARDLQPKGANFVAICSNDPNDYPEDSLPNLKKQWIKKKYPFPYLHDESQEVAKCFKAICTPDFFVYNSKKQLVYRGRLDNSWKDPSKVTHEEMREAIESLLQNRLVSKTQHPSMGCSIKWKE